MNAVFRVSSSGEARSQSVTTHITAARLYGEAKASAAARKDAAQLAVIVLIEAPTEERVAQEQSMSSRCRTDRAGTRRKK